MHGITRRFPGVLALENASFSLEKGEVVALLGENGAGKSTLMKILGGLYEPDEGAILLDGTAVRIRSVREATRLGIGFVHQELNLAQNLSVAENVFLAHEPRIKGLPGIMDISLAGELTLKLTRRLGLDIPPSTVVRDLTTGQQQLVEIARALSFDARILILDEPTSSLSEHESALLFRVVRELRESGISVIYISHRLAEVHRVADRVVVLKDGRNSGSLKREEISHDRMVSLMIGRDLSEYFRAGSSALPETSFEVRGLVLESKPKCSLSFSVNKGEVLGVFGLIGAGRTEMSRGVFGLDPVLGGEFFLNGEKADIRSPRDAISLGFGLVPEDRKLAGLILEMSVRENASLVLLGLIQKLGFWDRGDEDARVRSLMEQMQVKTPSLDQTVKYLSGGNQQKVVLAKWLLLGPRILILDEPTRGVDVGAKEEIYNLISDITKKGVSVIMISSEIEEIIGMSDRALVMHEGSVAGVLGRPQLTEEAIMSLATGAEAAHA